MEKKSPILLALGSNYDAEKNMEKAKGMLQHLLKGVVYSSCIWTTPINIDSDKFLNCLAYAESSHNVNQLMIALKQIERKCGDSKSLRRMSTVRMDIDILKYKGVAYHQKDWDRHYIQELFEELKAKNQIQGNNDIDLKIKDL